METTPKSRLRDAAKHADQPLNFPEAPAGARIGTALMSRRDAAIYLDMSPRNLERFAHEGGGPNFVKLGRLVRYRQADLDAWIASCLRSSTSDRGAA
jgi:predicted DNA-binding transcriptional regulator AlpA